MQGAVCVAVPEWPARYCTISLNPTGCRCFYAVVPECILPNRYRTSSMRTSRTCTRLSRAVRRSTVCMLTMICSKTSAARQSRPKPASWVGLRGDWERSIRRA